MKKFTKFSEGTGETEIDFFNRQYYTQCQNDVHCS